MKDIFRHWVGTMVYEGPTGRYSFTAELRFSLSSAIDREKPSSKETSGPRADRYYLSATTTFLFFASFFHSVESFVHKSEKWRGSSAVRVRFPRRRFFRKILMSGRLGVFGDVIFIFLHKRFACA